MILSCSWISLPCLTGSVIIRLLPRLCFLLTFFKLLDASILSCIPSKLYFRVFSLTYFFTALHISKYSMWSLGVLFSIISLRFFVRALVGDDIFGFFCFLVCFAMLIALCWIMSVMYLGCVCRHVLLMLWTCFSIRVETCSSSFQSFECQLLFGYYCFELPPFRCGV